MTGKIEQTAEDNVQVADAANPAGAPLFPRIEGSAHRRVDDRGYLEVLYESSTAVLKRSFSKKGVFRGMHVQIAPARQSKVIRVVSGSIADFVVAIDDPERVIHHSIITPADGWVLIEAHLAHGLFALEDTLFEYFCDGGYDESSEAGFTITDHIKAVLGVSEVILSPKDQAAPPLSDVSFSANPKSADPA